MQTVAMDGPHSVAARGRHAGDTERRGTDSLLTSG